MGSLADLLQAQSSHYGGIRCAADELSEWIDRVRFQVVSGASRVDIGIQPRRQLELWCDWPAAVLERPVEDAIEGGLQGQNLDRAPIQS